MTEWIGGFIELLLDLPPVAVAVFFFLTGIIEIIFQPWPGTTILVFGGCLTALGLPYGWLVVCVTFWLGETCGSFIVYEVGARGGQRVLDWKVIRGIFTASMQKKVMGWMEKYGAGMLAIAKFTAGVNTTAILLAGVAHMKRRKAYGVIAAFCALHNAAFYAGGVALGGTWEEVLAFMARSNQTMVWIALGLAVLVVLYFALRRIFQGPSSPRKEKRAED